jgi:hypothetical protein
MGKDMEKENLSMRMVAFMMVNGIRTKCMDMVKLTYFYKEQESFIMRLVIQLTMANGLKINLKAKALYITKVQKFYMGHSLRPISMMLASNIFVL